MTSFVGYAPLRSGRIHLFCPACKRKMSNTPRHDHLPRDPPTAVLAHVLCERCSVGCKDSDQSFMDGRGRWLCSYCGRHSCERMAGIKRCDERLIYRAWR